MERSCCKGCGTEISGWGRSLRFGGEWSLWEWRSRDFLSLLSGLVASWWIVGGERRHWVGV